MLRKEGNPFEIRVVDREIVQIYFLLDLKRKNYSLKKLVL